MRQPPQLCSPFLPVQASPQLLGNSSAIKNSLLTAILAIQTYAASHSISLLLVGSIVSSTPAGTGLLQVQLSVPTFTPVPAISSLNTACIRVAIHHYCVAPYQSRYTCCTYKFDGAFLEVTLCGISRQAFGGSACEGAEPFLDRGLVVPASKCQQATQDNTVIWTDAFAMFQLVMCSVHHHL